MDYMTEAYKQSMINSSSNFLTGGPFGAIVIDQEKNIIGLGHNQVLENHDPTAHAEMQAIRDACGKLNTHNLDGCILYTSCYPCPMCLSAVIWSNIKHIYYGNTAEDAEKIGFRDKFIYELLRSDSLEDNGIINLNQTGREITIKAFECFEAINKNNDIIY